MLSTEGPRMHHQHFGFLSALLLAILLVLLRIVPADLLTVSAGAGITHSPASACWGQEQDTEQVTVAERAGAGKSRTGTSYFFN